MVLKRLPAAASVALALVAGLAHAQTKTPAQLTAQTSIANGDLFMVWPASSNGPLHQVQFGVVESQLQAALGATYLQVANNLSDLNSPSLARGNLGLGALATEANPTSAQITTGLGFTPLNKAGDTLAGAITLGSTGAMLGPGVGAGFYSDASNIALRGENVSGSTIFFQSYGGSVTWASINSTGFVSNLPLSAPSFSGPLTGTASNALQLGGENAATAATASTIAARDASGNLTAATFYGSLSGSASQLGGESLATAATANTVAGRDSSGNLTAGTFNGALNGLASNSSALQGYQPSNNITANSIPVRDGNSNINVSSMTLGSTGAQVGVSVAAGYYVDSNNLALRALNSGSSSIFFQSYNGGVTWASINSSALTSFLPVTAPAFNGPSSSCAAGCTIGGSGNAAAFVNASGTGAGSISYGTAAPGTLAIGAIYLQTN